MRYHGVIGGMIQNLESLIPANLFALQILCCAIFQLEVAAWIVGRRNHC